MNKKEIAQWVIDNRYAKNESNKISDFEMYNHIIELMYKLTPIELPSDEEQEKFVHPRSDEYAAGFFRAMEMIEEQILNQNK